MRWITKWLWSTPAEERGQTLLAFDADTDEFVGYGTWALVDAFGTHPVDDHVEITWFGIDERYQGAQDDSGHSVAGRLLATVEADAQRSVAGGTPFTLVCHVDNERGLKFWGRRGFRVVPDPKLQVEDEIYYRMVR